MKTAKQIHPAPPTITATTSRVLSPTRPLSILLEPVSSASPPVTSAFLHTHPPNSLRAPTLAAILPITPDTLRRLEMHLQMLLEHPGALTEIVLLVPTYQHTKTRHALQAALTREDEADIEIRIAHWPPSADREVAIIRTAEALSTDWVLLLDGNGLRDLGRMTRDLLLLHGERVVAVPVGPHGVDYYLDGITCITPSSSSRRVAYLVPPMVVSTALLRDVDYASGNDYWAALGDSVSRSGPERSGGLVAGSPEDRSLDWCSRYAPTGLDGSLMSVHVINERTKVETGRLSLTEGENKSRQGYPGVILIVAQSVDLPYLSPIACALRDRGYRVSVLLAGVNGSTDSLPCSIMIEFLPETAAGRISLDVLADVMPTSLAVVLSATETSLFPQLYTFLAAHRPSVTHVHVPQADLPYTDWMTSLTLEEWKNWHVPQVELSVITNDRPYSLNRLLSSLDNARYFGDKLDMRINLEKSADRETLRIAGEYAWERGRVYLHHRIVHGGLLPAVVESWYPSGNDSYGLILEDDVELSPLFYAYVKLTLLRYRYGRPEDRSAHLFGISLYQQKNLELRPEGRHLFDARALFATAALPHEHTPYLSQIPCSWGALYFPEHWREFHAYLGARLAEHVWPLAQTVVPGVRSNRWTRSWKRYFIELVFLRGYVMLYPNYAAYASLSTNHLEVGSHVRDVPTDAYLRKKRLFNVPLMPLPLVGEGAVSTGLLELPDERLPEWSALPVLDLLGTIVDQELILQRGAERRAELTGCEEPPEEPYDTDELLCIR
ncbi:hypothetical protein BC628DRAFT_1329644 [Trametes gibbosa]|nr:hypothetical protein BC628DRAFT_1329644 [Trametes gibbosa]